MKIIDKAENALNKAGRGLAITKRRAKLKNYDFTIISNTCVGGVMTHFVGEQFRSPTVNLIIYEEQFLTFCRHLKEYSGCPVEEPTEEEAKQKWEERFKRVNYDDIFVVMDRGMSAREDILDEFNALPFEHKVFFTHKEDSERWPCNFRYDYYTPERYKEGHLYTNVKKGLEVYAVMDEFDFVTWLNDGTIQRNPDF